MNAAAADALVTSVDQTQVRPLDFFLARIPLMPATALDEFDALLRARLSASGVEHDILVSAAEQVMLELLAAQFHDGVLNEALSLASPSLLERLRDFQSCAGKSGAPGKLMTPLLRYLYRAVTRCTPFGLFASITLGRTAKVTRLELSSPMSLVRSTRMDAACVARIVDQLVSDPLVRERLSWRASDTLSSFAGQVRFVERVPMGREKRFSMASIRRTATLDEVIAACSPPATLQVIAERVRARRPDIDAEALQKYLATLTEWQVLVHDLDPPVTTCDPFRYVQRSLESKGLAGRLPDARRVAAQKNHRKRSVEVQIDAVRKEPQLSLSSRFMEGISQSLQPIARMGSRPVEELETFARLFRERYERESIPLAEALDPDIGLGSLFVSGRADLPLVEGLYLAPPERSTGRSEPRSAWTGMLAERVMQWVKDGRNDIVLSPADLSLFSAGEPPRYSRTCYAYVSMYAASAEHIDRGEYTAVLGTFGGGSAMDCLGRFACAEPMLVDRLRDVAQFESQAVGDTVLAEVCHLPEDSVGNVAFRAPIRRFEIPCLGTPNLAHARPIPIADLMVALDHDRVRLWSRSLHRWVEPRFSTAYSPKKNSLPVYRFLSRLQMQDSVGFNFHWPAELAELSELPRVRMKNLVLCAARWKLSAAELRSIEKQNSVRDLTHAVTSLREARRIPRHISIGQGDRMLKIDLTRLADCLLLRSEAAGKSTLAISESFADPANLPVSSDVGRFFGDLYVPVKVVVPTPRIPVTPVPATAPIGDSRATPGRRRAMPGSDWLYVKLYGGESVLDEILCNQLRPWLVELEGSNAIGQWHFLRYGDPEWHLRLRLSLAGGTSSANIQQRLHDLASSWEQDRKLARMTIDTYTREVEKYGGFESTDACERIFAADSRFVVDAIAKLGLRDQPDLRWRVALCALDHLLGLFGFSPAEKLSFARQNLRNFETELNLGGWRRQAIGAKFRALRPEIEPHFKSAATGYALGEEFRELLARRADECIAPVTLLREQQRAGQMNTSLASIVGNLAHLNVNRFCVSNPRAQEGVLYALATRLYDAGLRTGNRTGNA